MTDKNETRDGKITTELDGSTYCIIFDNQSRMNAVNTAMWAEIPKIMAEAEANPDVFVILMKGAGTRAFSAGADISEFGEARTGEAGKAYDELNHAAFNAVMNCPKPTVAMIRGFCIGGGLELALCCDLRYAAEGSSFSIPAAKLGIGYNSRWIRPLLSSLSASQAKEVLFTGRRFSAEEALAMGMISKLCSEDSLESETRALTDMIAANAPLSVRAAKAGIDAFVRTPENPDYEELDKLIQDCFDSEDYEEGRKAFAEKRQPVFKGR